MTTALLRRLHAAIVVVGVVGVLVLIRPVRTPDRRRVAELRHAAEDKTVVEAARVRAIVQLEERARAEAVLGSAVARHALWAASSPTLLAPVSVRRPSRSVAWFAVAANFGTAVLWAITRTVGLPFGLAEVGSVGAADLTSTVAEVLSAGAALYRLALRPSRAWWTRRACARRLPVLSGTTGRAR